VHFPASPSLAEKVPYTLVLVALDDAPQIRVIGDLLGDDPRAVHIGMPVVAEWSEHQVGDEQIRLPHWRARGRPDA
jgi:uncharacterized OB-fold protein